MFMISRWKKVIGLGLMLAGPGAGLVAGPGSADLIVVAAPRSDDPYYADMADGIFTFHRDLADRITGGDRLLVLTDAQAYDRYARAIGAERVAVVPMPDIWMRDFSLANPAAPVMFRYTAEGQGGGRHGQMEADAVQDSLADLAEEARLAFRETDLLNDGGNFVDDGAGNVVVSRKFLRDNGLSETEGRARLRRLTGARHVAFIEADEQGGLEHADGVVSFVAPGTLLVNAYPEAPDYAEALHRALRRGLPEIRLHEVVVPRVPGDRSYDARFGSACGLYTNALVTRDAVYLPQFGIPEDAEARQQVQALTFRTVVPVPTASVCGLGGGVRCLSWQLRGQNARRLTAWLRDIEQTW